jgi:hypothetical protein
MPWIFALEEFGALSGGLASGQFGRLTGRPLGRAGRTRSAHSDSVVVLRRGRFSHGNRPVPVFKVRERECLG